MPGRIMGSDAELYIFDHAKYTTDCLPQLHALISGKESAQWFSSYLKNLYPEDFTQLTDFTKTHPVKILDHCDKISGELDYIGYYHRDKVFTNGFVYHNHDLLYSNRYCNSMTCDVRKACLFHINQNNNKSVYAPMADFNYFFQEIIGNFCLTNRQFIGRSMTPFSYNDFFNQTTTSNPLVERLQGLLYLLGNRGYLAGYGWGNSDGIHGWLNYHETSDLVEILAATDLPSYPPTMSNINKIRYACDYMLYLEQPDWFSHSTKTFEVKPDDFALNIVTKHNWAYISLSFVGVIAKMALAKGHGILWGNDLIYDQKWG